VKPSVALYTAARRYCLERHVHWCERYVEMIGREADVEPDGVHYTAEALATFPRYNVLNAIRIELERIDPNTLGDLVSTRTLLIMAGEGAEDPFTQIPIGEIGRQAMMEERERFYNYVAAFSPAELGAVQPLRYRRVLSEHESESIRARLRDRWGIAENYWYPLTDTSVPGVVALNAEALGNAVTPEHWTRLLKRRGIDRCWELREGGPDYEQEIALFDPRYDGLEGFWSSESLDWIAYASHENSVTLGGWMADEIESLWPNWRDHIWKGAF
jgi:hypothetical protein